MDISDVRSEFSVYMICADYQRGHAMLEPLKAVGYGTHFYPTFDAALVAIKQCPPHVVILNFSNFVGTIEQRLTEIKDLSSEIQVIIIVSAQEVLQTLGLVSKQKAYDYVLHPFVSALDLVQTVDRAAEKLYFQFESEQLREEHDEVASVDIQPDVAPVSSEPALKQSDFTGFVTELKGINEPDPLILKLMEHLSSVLRSAPILYLKYLPQHLSLMVTQSVWLPAEQIRGVGIDLKNEDPLLVPDYLRDPSQMSTLKELVSEAFNAKDYFVFPHMSESEPVGAFLILDAVNDEGQRRTVEFLTSVFDLAYRKTDLLKQKHALEVYDPLTQLCNRRHFQDRLDEEISRSRRTGLPLSLINMDLDGFQNLNQKIGLASGDLVLKKVASILRKTSRTNDIVARVGGDEMAFLLPHTPHMGAAVKAERLRRIIEATQFPGLGPENSTRVTISIGVSEYPSFCPDAEGLISTADEALYQVKRAGGNKVCLAAAPVGFQPDFIPQTVKDTFKDRS